MDAAQLRQWLDGGQEIGAHTRHHVHLTQADAATCRDEIAGCKMELEDVTGAPIRHFCYPYGEFTQDLAAMVRQAGFESATTTQRGRCHRGEDLMQLSRVPVLRSTLLPLLWLKLATGYEDRRRSA
jgi:peptidoglycan/xylan/chitin deacetylase (PgdA/CDA1 family)